jgi:calcium permeable stress-gated cation channel
MHMWTSGFASGLIPAISKLDETTGQIPTILATSLPTSSTYFLTFILTNTFTAAASTNSRVVPVVLSKLAFIFRGKTPRKAFAYDYKMGAIALATAWPPIALLGCIAIVYTPIQPIVPAFSVVGLFLLYLVYKYLLVWVMDQPDHLETGMYIYSWPRTELIFSPGGLYYPRALRAIFVALYIMELCLVGLFFLLKGPDGKISTVGIACGAIMAAVIGLTAREYTLVKDVFMEDTDVAPP